MKRINLYAYGRSTVQGVWSIDSNRIVNRLYYVNSGTAHISHAALEYELVPGKIYIIPQSQTFRPLNAWTFDHMFFDFYHSRILRHDKIIELDEKKLSAKGLFEYFNFLIANDLEKKAHDTMEYFLSGFISALECQNFRLPYITNATITQAINLIHSDCSDISTKLLAKKLNLDESYFIRLFSSIMGMTPMKYIRAYRVSYGKELIRNGASIAEAAEKCGYASPSAFYNAVKAELHMSPSELKKQ